MKKIRMIILNNNFIILFIPRIVPLRVFSVIGFWCAYNNSRNCNNRPIDSSFLVIHKFSKVGVFEWLKFKKKI